MSEQCPHGLIVTNAEEPCLRCRIAELEDELRAKKIEVNSAALSDANKRITELERLLRLAYPWLMDMQAAAAITDEQHGTDESGDAYDEIRGICQQVQGIADEVLGDG